MVFSSAIFLWMFLPAVVCIHHLIKPQYANLFLLLASLFFYAWGEPVRVLLLLAVIVISHGAGEAIGRYGTYSRWILAAGVIFDLGVLGFYKYAGFVVRIGNDLAGRDIWQEPQVFPFLRFRQSRILWIFTGEKRKRGTVWCIRRCTFRFFRS